MSSLADTNVHQVVSVIWRLWKKLVCLGVYVWQLRFMWRLIEPTTPNKYTHADLICLFIFQVTTLSLRSLFICLNVCTSWVGVGVGIYLSLDLSGIWSVISLWIGSCFNPWGATSTSAIIFTLPYIISGLLPSSTQVHSCG